MVCSGSEPTTKAFSIWTQAARSVASPTATGSGPCASVPWPTIRHGTWSMWAHPARAWPSSRPLRAGSPPVPSMISTDGSAPCTWTQTAFSGWALTMAPGVTILHPGGSSLIRFSLRATSRCVFTASAAVPTGRCGSARTTVSSAWTTTPAKSGSTPRPTACRTT